MAKYALYLHSDFSVKRGDKLQQGQVIGTSNGNFNFVAHNHISILEGDFINENKIGNKVKHFYNEKPWNILNPIDYISGDKDIPNIDYSLCKILNISQSTYQRKKFTVYWDPSLIHYIKLIHSKFPYLGYRRLHTFVMRYFSPNIGVKTVYSYMKHLGIQGRVFTKRKWRYPLQAKDAKRQNLAKDLVITKPNQLWNADITYINVLDYKMSYLYTIRDDFDGRIVGYKYSTDFTYTH